MTARAVVFDLFHTLIDTEHVRPPGFRVTSVVAELLGIDDAAFARWWRDLTWERETTPIDLVDLVQRHLVPRRLRDVERAQLDHLFGVVPDAALARPDPEIVRLVTDIGAHMSVGVLSNCHEREVRTWNASPLAPLVDAFVGSCFVGAMKPDPEMYRVVLGRLGVDAGEALFVGNGGGSELAGATSIGSSTVIHTNVFDRVNGLVDGVEQRRRARQADRSVATVAELRAALFEHV